MENEIDSEKSGRRDRFHELRALSCGNLVFH